MPTPHVPYLLAHLVHHVGDQGDSGLQVRIGCEEPRPLLIPCPPRLRDEVEAEASLGVTEHVHLASRRTQRSTQSHDHSNFMSIWFASTTYLDAVPDGLPNNAHKPRQPAARTNHGLIDANVLPWFQTRLVVAVDLIDDEPHLPQAVEGRITRLLCRTLRLYSEPQGSTNPLEHERPHKGGRFMKRAEAKD